MVIASVIGPRSGTQRAYCFGPSVAPYGERDGKEIANRKGPQILILRVSDRIEQYFVIFSHKISENDQ